MSAGAGGVAVGLGANPADAGGEAERQHDQEEAHQAGRLQPVAFRRRALGDRQRGAAASVAPIAPATSVLIQPSVCARCSALRPVSAAISGMAASVAEIVEGDASTLPAAGLRFMVLGHGAVLVLKSRGCA